jgi:RecB family exonuclease
MAAKRTREGWQIVHGEDTETKLVTRFEVDASTVVQLQGRIDRIDTTRLRERSRF